LGRTGWGGWFGPFPACKSTSKRQVSPNLLSINLTKPGSWSPWRFAPGVPTQHRPIGQLPERPAKDASPDPVGIFGGRSFSSDIMAFFAVRLQPLRNCSPRPPRLSSWSHPTRSGVGIPVESTGLLKPEMVEGPQLSYDRSTAVSRQTRLPGIHLDPVSYTHLTLPTICSV